MLYNIATSYKLIIRNKDNTFNMERIALLVDQIGKGDNIFENFAIEFENARLKGDLDIHISDLQNKIEQIERILQDLSEKINAQNEHDNIYSLIIIEVRKILSIWLPAFSRRNLEPQIIVYFDNELDKLIKYLQNKNLDSKTISQIKIDFESEFAIGSKQVVLIEREVNSLNIGKLSVEWVEKIAESVVKSVTVIHRGSNLKKFDFLPKSKKKQYDAFKIISEQIEEVQNISQNLYLIEDGEDTIYTANMKLWIDTDDAAEANKFVNDVTQILSKIENVKILLVDSGKGSYWQNVKLKVKGWFAKEETKQVISKTQKAIEAYTLDRHIEPIEKSKVERQKQEEEIKRLMSEEQTKELHEIQISKEKEELEGIRLDNMQKKLNIMDKMSTMLANGLISTDSDYRIELEGIVLIQQKNKEIEINDINEINLDFKKELLPPTSSEESTI